MDRCIALERTERCNICARLYLPVFRETEDVARCGGCTHVYHASCLKNRALHGEGPNCPTCGEWFEEVVPLLGHRPLTMEEVVKARDQLEGSPEYDALTTVEERVMFSQLLVLRRKRLAHEARTDNRLLRAVNNANAAVQADLDADRKKSTALSAWEHEVLAGNIFGPALRNLVRYTRLKADCAIHREAAGKACDKAAFLHRISLRTLNATLRL